MDLPIKMLLPCPVCGRLHVDYGEWSSRLHTSHLCEHCGLIWKPCLLPTVGVEALCTHTWVLRRWFAGAERGVLQARFCAACGDRHPDDRMEKPPAARETMQPPPGAIFLHGEPAAAAEKLRASVTEYLDEATGTLRARITQPGKPTVTVEKPMVGDDDGPSYHPTPGMGLTDAGRRRLREVAKAGEPEPDPSSRPVCYGRGFVYQPQARAENDCGSCRIEAMCREVSPRPAEGNPDRNPAENPAGTPGVAPAPASGHG